MYDWFDKGWLHLVAISPKDWNLYHMENGEFNLYDPITQVLETEDIHQLLENREEMSSNHILDATKENVPVHVYPTDI